jgi:hypothetical protein
MTSRATVTRGRHYVTAGTWAIIDQALASGSNFLLAILVVRSVSLADFGAFSIAVLIYVLSVGVCRALTTEPLAIRFGRAVNPIMAQAPRCLGLALCFGTLVGTACVVAALSTGGTLRSVLLVLGVTFPLLIVQDAGRVACFALGRPRSAAANDAVWALVELPLVAVVMVQPDAETWHYVAAWLVPGAIAGVFMLVQLRVLPSLRGVGAWFADTRKLAIPLVWNYGLTAAPAYLLFALMPIVASLYELGMARSAYLPYGFFGVVFQSAWLVLLPAASRRSSAHLARLAAWSSAGLGALALVWSIVVAVAVPAQLGVTLFGESWNDTSAIRLIFAAAVVAQMIGVGPLVALQALEVPKLLVYVRLVTAPLMLAVGVILSARYGAGGLAVAILIGDFSATFLSWAVFACIRRSPSVPISPSQPDIVVHGLPHDGGTSLRPTPAMGARVFSEESAC